MGSLRLFSLRFFLLTERLPEIMRLITSGFSSRITTGSSSRSYKSKTTMAHEHAYLFFIYRFSTHEPLEPFRRVWDVYTVYN